MPGYYGNNIVNSSLSREQQINVTTAGTQLATGSGTTANLAGRVYVVLYNIGGSSVLYGLTSGVTTSNCTGAIAPGEIEVLPFGPSLNVYLGVQTGHALVNVTELR